ncbi:MAG: class I SAM-dependent methyltransferase [Gaiellaceae bacterium]
MRFVGDPCIVCGEETVVEFLDLGETALANKFRTKAELDDPEPRFPLRVGFCETCGHVQLTEKVPPQAMFDDYLYVSSASSTLTGHLHDLADTVVERHGLGREDLVVDIGANDGTLLAGFARHGVRTLGVDPARNLATLVAAGSGGDRYVGFFNSRSAKEIVEKWGPAAAITATNTFPHIPELDDFVLGIDTALAEDGVFVIEAHYLLDILEQLAFDTVYHEHVSYWALGPMGRIFERYGLEIVDAERLPIHHGQLRVTVARAGRRPVSPNVAMLREAETKAGIGEIAVLEEFAQGAHRIKSDLQDLLAKLKREGKRVVGYGAPAKGNTLIGFLELGPETIEYIADVSPLKQGRYTPNVPIPVVPPERLLEDRPDYVLLLAWNFADEILEQQVAYRQAGGRFILPVPNVRIVE